MRNGGPTHVRYEHVHRPALLHVLCPRCAGEASARKVSEEGKGEHIMDLAGTMEVRDWGVRCGNCGYRKEGLGFDELPPLFYRASAGGVEAWGWNREHFGMILTVLEGGEIGGSPYAWFAAYIPGRWLRSRRRLAEAVRKKLKGG